MPEYTAWGSEINRTEGEYMPVFLFQFNLIDWFHWLSYGINSLNYTSEVLSPTEIKITITEVADYYPHPVKWNDINYRASKISGDYPTSWSATHYDFDSIKVYQGNDVIFDLVNPESYSSEMTIQKGQYFIFKESTHNPFIVNFYSLKYHESFELPYVNGLGDKIFVVYVP